MYVRIWLNEQRINTHIVPGSWHQQSSPFSSSPKVLLSRHNSAQSLGGVKDTNLVCILWQVWRSPTLMRNERMFVRLQSISYVRPNTISSSESDLRGLNQLYNTALYLGAELVIMYISLWETDRTFFEVFHEICSFSTVDSNNFCHMF